MILRWLGLFSVTGTYPFIIVTLLMLISLGCVVVKHITKRSRYSVIMWSGHLGLWFMLAAGIFGAADHRELRVSVPEGNEVGMGVDHRGAITPLDFTIRLEEFSVDYYPNGGAKHYASTVMIDGGKRSEVIEVNHPLRMGNYFIYQSGHRNENGVDTSIFKVVYDSYTWMWYVGIGLLILSSLMIFVGKIRTNTNELG